MTTSRRNQCNSARGSQPRGTWGRSRFIAVLICVGVATTAHGSGNGQAMAALPGTASSVNSAADNSWRDLFLYWLNFLWNLLEGDGPLNSDPATAMSQVCNWWDGHGWPTGMTANDKANAHSAIGAVRDLLATAPAGIDLAVVARMKTTLTSMEAAL
jgi:hypothetical protein